MTKGLDIFALATDKDAAISGVEKDWKGATVIVARANNQEYLKYIAAEYEKNRAVIDKGDDNADKVAENINNEGFIRYILVGWDGFINPDKTKLIYNLKNARIVCDKVPDLVRDVRLMSANDENYRVAKLKEDAEGLGK